jgi:Xaa-Pro aminopeptidase
MDDARIKKLQRGLTDCLLIDNPVDLLYLTGLTLSVGRMALFPDRSCLFVDARYIESAKREAPCEARMKQELVSYLQHAGQVVFDSSYLTYDAYRAMEKNIPGKEWTPVSKPLKELRAIKEKSEIAALKRAARLTLEGYRHIAGLLKEGVAEEELALEFEIYCRRHGASKLSFQPNIAFGENSAFPHYRAGKDRLKKDQIILCDLGAVVDGYAGDMTRVMFFGRPDPQLERDYRLVQRVRDLVAFSIRPGIRFGDLDRMAREELRKEGVDSLFTHGLSHGVGLDLHEFPTLRLDGGDADVRLAPGMVITVEPGLYRPGLGGVRYEDTVLVTEAGVENLTC